MQAQEFAVSPAHFGLPTRDDLVALRIWDLHYHGFLPSGKNEPLAEHEAMGFYTERMGIERSFALDIGGTRRGPLEKSPHDEAQRRVLEEQKDRLSGLIRIDPSEPERSVEKIDEWIARGPCVGIKYAGFGNRDDLRCDHPNNDPIVRRAAELGAMIYIHTWMKVGGEPRRPGGGTLVGENTPENLIALSRRFPGVPLILGHAAGDWEMGVRMARAHPDILVEFAGSDPHSGAVDLAVREVGVERVVWGAHGSSRSYATELAKVFDADLTQEQRMKILGGNLRRVWARMFRSKGYRV